MRNAGPCVTSQGAATCRETGTVGWDATSEPHISCVAQHMERHPVCGSRIEKEETVWDVTMWPERSTSGRIMSEVSVTDIHQRPHCQAEAQRPSPGCDITCWRSFSLQSPHTPGTRPMILQRIFSIHTNCDVNERLNSLSGRSLAPQRLII